VLFPALHAVYHFFSGRAKRERERKKELPRCYAVTRSSLAACKNIQYLLVRQLVKYCARAVFRYAFHETNLPRICYGGFHEIFDRDDNCVREPVRWRWKDVHVAKVLITRRRISSTGVLII